MSCSNNTALTDVQRLVNNLETDANLLHQVVNSPEHEITVEGGQQRKTLAGLLNYIETTVDDEIAQAMVVINEGIEQSAANALQAQEAANQALAYAEEAAASAASIDVEAIEEQIDAVAEYLGSHVIDANPHPHYRPPWNDVTGKPDFFAAKWGVVGTIDGYDPKDFGYVKVWDQPTSTLLSLDIRSNFGDGDFLIRTAGGGSGYHLTTNNENNSAMVGGNNQHLGNIFVAGTSPSTNYMRVVYKKVKN